MVLSELRKTPHLSASAIGTYTECSLMYKFAKIDKIPMETISDAMEFGSTIHITLEYYYQEKMLGEKMLLKDVHEIFEVTWRKRVEGRTDMEYTKGHDFKFLLMMGKDLLTVWYNKLPDDNYNIIGIEEAFSFNMPGIELPFIGVIDLLEQDESGTIIVTDHKTAGKAYSIADVDSNQQIIKVKQHFLCFKGVICFIDISNQGHCFIPFKEDFKLIRWYDIILCQ